MNGTIGE